MGWRTIVENNVDNDIDDVAKNMDLLTNQLVMLSEEVTRKHMANLREQERIELKRVRGINLKMRKIRETKVYTFEAISTETQVQKTKLGNAVRRNQIRIKAEEEQKKEEESAKEIITAGDILGVSNKSKNIEFDESSKENFVQKPSLAKFRKAAKQIVLMEILKKGHDFCTCENLDATCKVHDCNLNSDGNESNESSDAEEDDTPLKLRKFRRAANTTVLVKECTCEDPDVIGACRVHGCFLNDFYLYL
jgi:hypothetical protein